MRTLGVFLFLIFLGSVSVAQQDVHRDPDRFFAVGNYSSALPYYLKSLKKDSLNPKLNYKIGYCYLQSRSMKHMAVKYLERSVRVVSDGSDYQSPVAAFKYLGDAYHLNNQFDLAISTYEKYRKLVKESKNPDPAQLREADWKIGLSKVARELNSMVKQAHSDSLLQAGSYSSLLTSEKLEINITFKNGLVPHESSDQLYFESVLYPQDYQLKSFPPVLRDTLKPIMNEATIGTSVDGQIVLTYKVKDGNGDLYISRLRDNKWSAPEKLDEAVNAAGWEDGECISADGHTLFFVSDRPDGFGGKDLYKARLLPNGTWSKAQNLGPSINTAYDEEAPFIHPDGRTLYFSSNGHRRNTEFDVYSSQVNENGIWSRPVNVGYPVDTTRRMETYPLIADGGPDSPGNNKIRGGSENYQVTFLNDKGAPLNVISGDITDEGGKNLQDLKIIVSDNDTYEVSGVYYPFNGRYSVILPRGRNNNISYEVDGYLFHSENIDLTKNLSYYDLNAEVKLKQLKEGASTILKNVFFEDGKPALLQTSGVELKKLASLMKNNPGMVISIETYVTASEKDNVKYNAKLAEKRSKAIADYLSAGGIGAERMNLKGYGKAPKVKEKKFKASGEKTPTVQTQWVELKIEKMK